MKLIPTLLFLIFSLTSILYSQSILGVPKDYKQPMYFEDQTQANRFENNVNLDKTKKKSYEEWLVISDRSNNYTYESKNLNNKKSKLAFREIAYVIEDNTGWLELGQKNGGIIQSIGWIPKKNVLQWRRGLVDSRSGINLKGFILNKLRSLQLQKLEYASLYDDPESKNPIDKLSLHDFYFVFKVHRDDTGKPLRYLLANNSVLGRHTTEYLKGWVDVEKITEWNTRLSLEPNFTKEGFAERHESKDFHIKGLADRRQAEIMTDGQHGRLDERKIFWDEDPVHSKAGVAVNSSNPRRLLGDQIRFPILDNTSKAFSSGILATIEGQSDNTLKSQDAGLAIDPEVRRKIQSKSENLNLIYVIEGCEDYMKDYVRVIKNVTTSIKRNSSYNKLKVSLGIYKDILESDKSDYFIFNGPTESVDEVSDFLDGVYWGRSGDFEEMTCWKYGLYKSLKSAELSDSVTNVVVQLGNYDDFSLDEFRVEEAAKKYLLDRKDLRSIFSKYDVNWLVVNVNNDDSYFSDSFNDNIREHINEMTKEIYVEYTEKLSEKIKGINIPTPYTPKLNSGLLISTENFITQNKLLRTEASKRIGQRDLETFLMTSLDEIGKFNNDMLKLINGQEISIDKNTKLSAAAVSVLIRQINQQLGKRTTVGEVQEILGETKLFANVYFSKQQPNQVYDPFSLVLFMPENDLKSYVDELEKLKNAIDGSKSDLRSQLQKAMTEMGKKFAAASLKEVGEMEPEDIFDLMTGVDREGFSGMVSKVENSTCKIKYITNKKKCTDQALVALADRIVLSTKKLGQVYRAKPPYEFQYSTDDDNTYYWIPVEYMY